LLRLCLPDFFRRALCAACGLLVLLLLPAPGAAQDALKVRAITAFVPMDPLRSEATLEEAAEFLDQTRAELQAAGLEVQTLRLATPPLAGYYDRLLLAERLDFFLRLDRWAGERGLVVSLGPALVEDVYDAARIDFVVELLERTSTLSTSVVIADEAGVHPQALRAAAEIIRRLGARPAAEPLGFRFAALARCPPGIPFFPAAYADGKPRQFALGLESAGVFARALGGEADEETKRLRLRAAVEGPLQHIESLALAMAEKSGWTYLGIDTSPAPNGAVSIAAAVEGLAGRPLGGAGTLAAVSALTNFLQTLAVRKTGFNGLMLPVLEDAVLAERVAEGRVSLQLLLTYSAVSGTGLDVVPLPGDTSPEALEGVLADVAALAVKLRKPLTARLLVVAGKRAGDLTEFDSPWLTNTKVMALD